MRTTRRSDSFLYRTWYQFMNGTTNPQGYAWHYYGARGVTMYRPWQTPKTGFDLFEDYVLTKLGYPPSNDSILCRVDSSKDIEPGNLIWSTRKLSGNNRITNHRVTINGTTNTIAKWCEDLDLCYATVWSRIVDRGYTPEEAINYHGRK
jgi:hypothetical protein